MAKKPERRRGAAQRQLVHRCPDRVGLYLGPRHQPVAARRAWGARRAASGPWRRSPRPCRGPRPPATCPAAASANDSVGTVPAPARGSRSRRRRSAKSARSTERPRRRGDGHGDALQPALLVPEPAQDAALVLGQVGGRGARADRGQVLVASEHVRAPAAVGLARGEHGATRSVDRVVERTVLALGGRLGELDVDDDLPSRRRAEAVDRAAVQRTRERPLLPRAPRRSSRRPRPRRPPRPAGRLPRICIRVSKASCSSGCRGRRDERRARSRSPTRRDEGGRRRDGGVVFIGARDARG